MGKERPTFSKRGRPRENVVERRLDIYERVAPLLAERGMRGMSMKQAARAAHVSVGTLYRYFPDKRSLVLYGLDPEPADLLCSRFARSSAHLKDREEMRAALAAFVVQTIQLMRPSVDAAIRLGPEVVRGRLDEVAGTALDIFPALLARGMPVDDGRTPEQVERVVRKVIVSTLMENEFASAEIHRTIEGVIAGPARNLPVRVDRNTEPSAT